MIETIMTGAFYMFWIGTLILIPCLVCVSIWNRPGQP